MGSITTLAQHLDLDLSCTLGAISVTPLLLLPSILLAFTLENCYFHCHGQLCSELFLTSAIIASSDTSCSLSGHRRPRRVLPPNCHEKPHYSKDFELCLSCRRVRSREGVDRVETKQKEFRACLSGHFCLSASQEVVFQWKRELPGVVRSKSTQLQPPYSLGDRGQESASSKTGINATDFFWKNNEHYFNCFSYKQ